MDGIDIDNGDGDEGWAAFDARKHEIVCKIGNGVDRSPKGSVDDPIVNLIAMINRHRNYVTTSSCSGRISLYEETEVPQEERLRAPKKGNGRWLLAKHARLESVQELLGYLENASRDGNVVMKHEPFVLHVLCRDVKSAQSMLRIAIDAGFRESGISLGGKKTMLGIRTSGNVLEVPLIQAGKLLVTKEYLQVLVETANSRFDGNRSRTLDFQRRVQELMEGLEIPSSFTWKGINLAVPENEVYLRRWGHSANFLQDSLIVFGGYGEGSANTSNCHRRLGDTIRISKDMSSGVLRCEVMVSNKGMGPSPRVRHTATTLSDGRSIVLFGGRQSPSKPLNDIYVYQAGDWNTPSRQGDLEPEPRWSHSAASWGDGGVIVFGGRSTDKIFDDLWLVRISREHGLSNTWTRPDAKGEGPCARFLHSCCTVGGKLVVYGGYATLIAHGAKGGVATETGILGDVYVLTSHAGEQPSWEWSKLRGTESVIPRFSHQAMDFGKDKMLVFGGVCDDYTRNCACLLDLRTGSWEFIPSSDAYGDLNEPITLFVKFALAKCPSWGRNGHPAFVAVGGGLLCFSFGFYFSPTCLSGAPEIDDRAARENEMETNHVAKNGISNEPNALVIPTVQTKAVKLELEKLGWYDRYRKISPYDSNGNKALPLTKEAVKEILSNRASDGLKSLFSSEIRSSLVKIALPEGVKAKLSRSSASKKRIQLSDNIMAVCAKVSPEIPQQKFAQELPTRIEIMEDVAIIPKEAFKSRKELWQKVFDAGEKDRSLCIWEIIAKDRGVRRVLLGAEVDPGLMRKSRANLVYPRASENSCWVQVKQNGVLYSLDLTKCMFSSGNISEKQRVAKFDCSGEVVVDMFAGIGYFTLPYLVHTGAKHVHACEWNPDALLALRRNLEDNHVQDRCTVHAGDNRISAVHLVGVADRINLGLIPSSEGWWAAAIKMLNTEKGGWLHVHGNVPSSEVEKWGFDVAKKISGLCREQFENESWTAHCVHVERVKSYSPRILHLVADVHCSPFTQTLEQNGVAKPAHSQEQSEGKGMATPAANQSRSSLFDYCIGLGRKNSSRPQISRIPVRLEGGEALRRRPVKRVPFPMTHGQAQELINQRYPVIFTGTAKWNEQVFRKICQHPVAGEREVSVHVGDEFTEGRLSFVERNFKFEVMKFKELIDSAADPASKKYLYLRAVGANMRKNRADFWKDFPEVSELTEFGHPEHKLLSSDQDVFSSVLRVASKDLQLWTHYDVMDNILFQTHGNKTIVLFSPEDVDALYFEGSTSQVINIHDENSTREAFPLFQRAMNNSVTVKLGAGEALFIPALWPHNAKADTFSVAVNVFWKSLPDSLYFSKDLYGNKDPIPAEQCMELVAKAKEELNKLPDGDFARFYSKKAASLLLSYK